MKWKILLLYSKTKPVKCISEQIQNSPFLITFSAILQGSLTCIIAKASWLGALFPLLFTCILFSTCQSEWPYKKLFLYSITAMKVLEMSYNTLLILTSSISFLTTSPVIFSFVPLVKVNGSKIVFVKGWKWWFFPLPSQSRIFSNIWRYYFWFFTGGSMGYVWGVHLVGRGQRCC